MGVSVQHHDPTALPPRKNRTTHRTGGWVGPRAGLDGCGKKISCPHRESIPEPSSLKGVAMPAPFALIIYFVDFF